MKVRKGGSEEIPLIQGKKQWLRFAGAAVKRYPMPLGPRPGTVGGRSYPTPEARGGGREDQSHVQGTLAAWVQEDLEDLSHIEGQEGWR